MKNSKTDYSRVAKILALFLTFLFFIVSLPGVYQNAHREKEVIKELEKDLSVLKNICDSNCTSYPKDWLQQENREVGEMYCREQCSHNMKDFKKDLIENIPWLYSSKYNLFVAKTYCLLGLRCAPLNIINFIENYQI